MLVLDEKEDDEDEDEAAAAEELGGGHSSSQRTLTAPVNCGGTSLSMPNMVVRGRDSKA